MKFLIFVLLLWVIFALLDPDPDSEYGSGSGSTHLIESGLNPDPKPSLSLHMNAKHTTKHSTVQYIYVQCKSFELTFKQKEN